MSKIKKSYHDNGIIYSETYYNENNEYHREDGPAIIKYDSNGKLGSKEYWEHGKRHRKNGPAIELYNNEEELLYFEFFINGKDQSTYTFAIINWKFKNNFKFSEDMSEEDYDRMWMEIL